MAAIPSNFSILSATSAEDLNEVASLFRAYARWLDIDLSFQGFETELASLPGKYSQDQCGSILLAKDSSDGFTLGVVALRALKSLDGGADSCEVKRLYVAPEGRGQGVGLQLAEAVIKEARVFGYRTMLLDTLPHMEAARKLYRRLGFETCEKYYETPRGETVFMRKVLCEGQE